MKKLNWEDFINLLLGYATEDKIQERPAIVWFDNVGTIIRNFTPHSDPAGLASWLSAKSKKFVFYDKPGSPLTDHDYLSDGNRGRRKLSDEEREQFVVPSIIKPGVSKVFIHAPYICYIGEKGLTSIEYCAMIHDRLKMPVFLFFDAEWKDSIKADLSQYDEYLCSELDDLEQWLDIMSEKDDEGIQILDNFYLDFLRQASKKFISYRYDPRGRAGVTFCDYARWQDMGWHLKHNVINSLIENCYNSEKHLTEDQLLNLMVIFKDTDFDFNSLESISHITDGQWTRLLFKDGNLNLKILESILAIISDETWNEWYNRNEYEFRIDSYYGFDYNYNITVKSKRIDIVKAYLCSIIKHRNMPTEASIALMKFHGL